MIRFVILAVPRTGSNLLCTLLNSHPQIVCHHELFNPQGIFAAHDYRGEALAAESLNERDRDPLAFLERVWQTAPDSRCVGFKWTLGQSEEVLESVVHDRAVRKLVLRRGNRIKTFVSQKIAETTCQWEVYEAQELAMPRPRVHVDPDQLLEHIATNQKFYGDLSDDLLKTGQPHLTIDYETLFDGRVRNRMLEFLNVETEFSLHATSVKQNATDLRESISNFGELQGCLPSRALLEELLDRGM
jgi:LPS sulfotransferase NodH